jgi:mannan endo-1,4-beta-mannosidase
MPRLDYVLDAAAKRGLKIMLVLTNNWKEFGGMDQYVVWYGAEYHHEFYTNKIIKEAFKEWIRTIVLRKNSISGKIYRDDPTILAWELANEPRCRNNEELDGHEGWDTTTMVTWADEMSRYIKELDPNHMVGVGDEGFLNDKGNHWTHNAYDGVDHEALSAVANIDYATFHLYPDNWGTGVKFGYHWIRDHIEVAKRIGKPTILEEYGTIVQRNEKTFEVTWGWERRKTVYTNYQNLIREGGGAAAIFWMLGGVDDEHGTYPDYDHYIIYHGEPSADLIHENAIAFKSAPACRLTGDLVKDVPASPFVSAVRLPR